MIGLIAAMPSEMDAIIACLDNQKEHTISGIKMVSGTIANKEVVVMLSGVGKCRAALSTTILCEHFKLEEIIPNDKNEVSVNGITRRATLRHSKSQNADSIEL